MKSPRLAAIAATAFLAAGIMAEAAPKALPVRAQVTRRKDAVAIAMKMQACTKDGYLVTGTETHAIPVRETFNAMITNDGLRDIERAYGQTYGPFRGRTLQIFMNMLTAEQVRGGIRQYNDPTGIFSDVTRHDFDEGAAEASRQITALPPAMKNSWAEFSAAVSRALGRAQTDRSHIERLSYTVSAKPAKECGIKPR